MRGLVRFGGSNSIEEVKGRQSPIFWEDERRLFREGEFKKSLGLGGPLIIGVMLGGSDEWVGRSWKVLEFDWSSFWGL